MTRQRDRLIATFNNYDKVLAATEISLNAVGTAEEKYVAYMDSIDAKLAQLTATWERLVNNLNQGDTFKSLVDLATRLVDVLDVLLNQFDIIGKVVVPAGILTALLKINKEANKVRDQFALMAQIINRFDASNGPVQSIEALQTAIAGLSGWQQKVVTSTVKANAAQAAQATTSTTAAAATGSQAVATVALDAAQKKATVSAWSLTAAIQANPVFWSLAAIAAAIAAFNALLNYYKKLAEEQQKTIDSARELRDEYKRLNTELETSAATAREVSQRWAELRQGISANGENISLTSNQYEEFLSLNKQLAELFPTQIKGYDDSGNAILNLSGNVNELTNSIEELIIKEREIYNANLLSDKDTLFEGMLLTVQKNNNEIAKLSRSLDNLDTSGLETVAESYNRIFSAEDSFGISEYRQELEALGATYQEVETIIKTSEGDLGNAVIGTQFIVDPQWIEENAEAAIYAAAKSGRQLEAQIIGDIQRIGNLTERELAEYMPIINAYLTQSIDYAELDRSTQEISKILIKNLNISELISSGAIGNASDFEQYIEDTIISPLFALSTNPRYLNAINGIFNLNEQYKRGKIDADEYRVAIETNLIEIASSADANIRGTVVDAFNEAGYAFKGFADVVDYVRETFTIATSQMIEVKETTAEIISEVMSLADVYGTLSSAVNEYNEKGYISLQTLDTLLKLAPEHIQYLIDENGALVLNEQALRNIIAARLEDALAVEQENLSLLKQAEVQKTLEQLLPSVTQRLSKMAIGFLATGDAAGLAAASIIEFARAAAELTGAAATTSFDTEAIRATEARIAALQNVYDNLDNVLYDINSSSKSKEKEDKTDYWKKEFEALYAELKHQRDMDLISEQEYLEQLDSLYRHYFEGREEYLTEYYKYSKEVYEGLKKLQEDALKREAELAIASIDKRINALKDEKQALKERNEEEDLLLKIQKARDRYNAAKSQKTNRVYTNENGWIDGHVHVKNSRIG